MIVKSLSRVRLLATPWTATHQAPPSMGFSRQEYWSGVPLPSPAHSQKHRGHSIYPHSAWESRRGTGNSWQRENVGGSEGKSIKQR